MLLAHMSYGYLLNLAQVFIVVHTHAFSTRVFWTLHLLFGTSAYCHPYTCFQYTCFLNTTLAFWHKCLLSSIRMLTLAFWHKCLLSSIHVLSVHVLYGHRHLFLVQVLKVVCTCAFVHMLCGRLHLFLVHVLKVVRTRAFVHMNLWTFTLVFGASA